MRIAFCVSANRCKAVVVVAVPFKEWEYARLQLGQYAIPRILSAMTCILSAFAPAAQARMAEADVKNV